MIIIEVYKKNNDFYGCKVSGHAFFNESGGDVVCASVSSAVQLIINGLLYAANVKLNIIKKSSSLKKNYISFYILENQNLKYSNLFMKAFCLHINLLIENYSKFLSFELKQVNKKF